MKVYVVATQYEFEGYSEPEEVFSTREAAEAWASEHTDKYSTAYVFEMEVEGLAYEYGHRAPGMSPAPSSLEWARDMHERWGDKIMRRTAAGEWEEVEA